MEINGKIKTISNGNEVILPITSTKAVLDENGKSLDSFIEDVNKMKDITPFNIKGKVNSVDDLPLSSENGDLYFVGKDGSDDSDEYVWTEDGWEIIGNTDLSGVEEQINSKADNNNTPLMVESSNSNLETTKGSGLITGFAKNLLKVTCPSTEAGGIKITNNNDGTISVNGTATRTIDYGVAQNFVFKDGVTYKVSGKVGPAKDAYLQFNYRNSNNAVAGAQDFGNGSILTNLGVYQTSMYIHVKEGIEINEIWRPMIVEATEDTHSYVPYQYDIVTCGKNLVSSWETGKVVDYQTGRILPNDNYCVSNLIPVKMGQSIISSNVSIGMEAWTYKSDGTPYKAFKAITGITINDENMAYIRVSAKKDTYLTAQVEFGTIATEFEPYQGEAHTVSPETQTPITFKTYEGATNILSPSYVNTVVSKNNLGNEILNKFAVDKEDVSSQIRDSNEQIDMLNSIASSTRCELSENSWYRIAEFKGRSKSEVIGAASFLPTISLMRYFNNADNECHQISLISTYQNISFINENSKSNTFYITQIRYVTSSTDNVGYIDIKYASQSSNTLLATIFNGLAYTRGFKAISTPYTVDDTKSGETIHATYTFSNNRSIETRLAALEAKAGI